MALAVLGAGRHLLLEGPVGVGKTTVALAVCAPSRPHDGARRRRRPLLGEQAHRLVRPAPRAAAGLPRGVLLRRTRWCRPCARARVLFINELNRMPETVQNVLLPALDERLVQVPHIGEVRAADGFQVVATQNPVEYVATGHLSEALRDRFEHLVARLPVGRRRRRHRPPRDGLRRRRAAPRGRAPHAAPRACIRAFARERPCAPRSPWSPSPRAWSGRRLRRSPRGAAPRGRRGADHARRPARRHRRRPWRRARRALRARRRPRRRPRRRAGERARPQKPERSGRGAAPAPAGASRCAACPPAAPSPRPATRRSPRSPIATACRRPTSTAGRSPSTSHAAAAASATRACATTRSGSRRGPCWRAPPASSGR